MSFWVWTIIIIAVIALLVVINLQRGKTVAVTLSDPSTLPGLQTGTVPWVIELAHLRERLQASGLPALSSEGSALHIHQHLDIFVNGQAVSIPAGIGVDQMGGFISPIHVHDTTSIIHVESPIVQTFTLGQFFDTWGVRFTNDCIGGYCATATSTLKIYADGTPYKGDPRVLPLKEHEEIVVVYGTGPASIPSTFAFPQGY